mgnify:CR=1 FL=1
MDKIKKDAKKDGHVSTLFGRRVHVPNITHSNFQIRSAAERTAINAPIQGSASEIMRLAMIRLNKKFEQTKNNQCKMLLQIHDELIFETPKEEVKRISKMIIEEMTSVANSDQHSFSIPLTVDLNTGDNWGSLH